MGTVESVVYMKTLIGHGVMWGRSVSDLAYSDWMDQGECWGIPCRAEAPELQAEPSDWPGPRGPWDLGGHGRGRVLGENCGCRRVVRQWPGLSGSRCSGPRRTGIGRGAGPGAVVGAPGLWLRNWGWGHVSESEAALTSKSDFWCLTSWPLTHKS